MRVLQGLLIGTGKREGTMPNEIEIICKLIRRSQDGDFEAGEELKRIIKANIESFDLADVASMGAFLATIKQCQRNELESKV